MADLSNANLKAVKADIAAVTGLRFQAGAPLRVNGGDVSRGWRATDAEGRHWFLKTNTAELIDLFVVEQDGLQALQQAQDIRVPEVAGYGVAAGSAWLLMEWLDLHTPTRTSDERFGLALAGMHKISAEQFGWHRDNRIGSTHQSNAQTPDWLSFYRDERLTPQLQLARRKGAPESLFVAAERLLPNLQAFFNGYEPVPALLHGDLWGGNRSALADGTPVLFDPAVYYGDREIDLSMTQLFGGFGGKFYAAYNEVWALDSGHKLRTILYNLYHVLNHYNLFGGAYAEQAEAMIGKLLAEI